MQTLPTGTVTFLLTDIENSAGHWEEAPTEMEAGLAVHDAAVEEIVPQYGGSVFKHVGDGCWASFPSAPARPEKRLAELCFRYFDDEDGRKASREAMERARDWYRRAFDQNPSANWSGVQYLALQAALEGQIDAKHWATTYRAAEVDRTRPNEYWAHGSLAELALLAPLVEQGTDESAESYLLEMKTRVAELSEPPSHDPFESTALQLRRYVDWWQQKEGFLPGTVDLAPEAAALADLISA